MRMTDLPPDTAAPIDNRPAPSPVRTDPVTRFFGGSPLWVLVKLAMLSVVIGVILAVLDVDALAIVRAVQDLFYSFFENIWDALETVLRWFTLGAVIVFPIWLISRLLHLGKR
jgi:hypothetical protein